MNKQVSSRRHLPDRGFTLVEAMLATAIFSLSIVIAITAFVQVNRIYHRGITTSRVQEDARSLIDELSRTIQFADGGSFVFNPDPDPNDLPAGSYDPAGAGAFCIGSSQFTFNIDVESGTNRNVLGLPVAPFAPAVPIVYKSDRKPGCTPAPDTHAGDGYDLVRKGFVLKDLQVTEISLGVYRVEFTIAANQSGVLTGSGSAATCQPGGAGTQFCAVTTLSTIVSRRVD